jgi:sorting nexin-29
MLRRRIHRLIEEVWETEQIPQEWSTALICPIHKKGNKLECSIFLGISLLNAAYKIFTNVLARSMEPYVEEMLGEYQSGFRRGRSTTDNIFSLRIILEKAYEYNVDIHQLYVDYKQAYDSINRAQLIEIMKKVWGARQIDKAGQDDFGEH